MSDQRFGVIAMDPPWKYGGTRQFQRRPGGNRLLPHQHHRYASLPTAAIAALPVARLAADPCVLLMWATWPLLEDALACIRAYGFSYVTGFPWIKVAGPPKRRISKVWRWVPQYGIGFWVRSCSEPLLIARRGDITIRSPQIGLLSENFSHSRKPDNLYEYAEQFPGPYLELFARRAQPGWRSWGDQAPAETRIDLGDAGEGLWARS